MVFGQQLFQSRTDGQPMNFEWKIFTGLTTMGIPESDSTDDGKNYSVNLGTSQAGSSRQCLTTLCGMRKEMMKNVKTIQRQ